MADRDPFRRLVPLIDKCLRRVLETPHPLLESFYGMMRYHLGWLDENLAEASPSGGKYVRPVLTLLCCEAAGGDLEAAMPAAIAVELVHNFSLVHDDIEDRSEFRRHRRTVWKIWGDAQAINVGDGLFALARLHAGRLTGQGVSAHRAMAAARVLDETCVALTEGQFMDLHFETLPEVSLDDYLWMIRDKTAALLACACQVGAVVASGDSAVIRALHDFGYNLGMAFQIEDDILGIWGDPKTTGKPAGDDVLNRKKTLPVVYAWEQSRLPEATDEVREAAALLRDLYGRQDRPVEASDVQRVIGALENVRAREYCASLSQDYTRLALNALSHPALANEAATQLRQVAEALLNRSR